MNALITLLSIVIWIGSSYIANYIYPSDSLEDINNFWELKKILYSVSILLIVFSKSFVENRLAKFLNICYIGIVLEDITDRLIFNVNQYELNDIIAIEITVLVALVAVYKKEINDFRNKNSNI